jgi:Spy/CpxP family protein refolding chaperone
MGNIKSIHWIVGLTIFLFLVGFRVNAQQGRGNGPGFGYAYRHGSGFGDGPGGGNSKNFRGAGRLEAFLDLTDEQDQQFEKIRLDFQKVSLPTFNKIGEKRAQLKTLISENGDLSEIDQLIDDIGELQVSLKKQRVKNHLKIREVLTEDQKTKFDTHFGNRFDSGGQHFRSAGCFGWGMN